MEIDCAKRMKVAAADLKKKTSKGFTTRMCSALKKASHVFNPMTLFKNMKMGQDISPPPIQK